MSIKTFLNTPEEIFIGSVLQFPLYFIVGWWVIPIMLACGVLWRLGGMEGGHKLFRRLGVPSLVCASTIPFTGDYLILLAIPFMVWLCPSYGKTSFFYTTFLKMTHDKRKADFFARCCTYLWYWLTFGLASIIPF